MLNIIKYIGAAYILWLAIHNLIAQRLELNRIAPFNSSELFDSYKGSCEYAMGYDDEGFKYGSPVLTKGENIRFSRKERTFFA